MSESRSLERVAANAGINVAGGRALVVAEAEAAGGEPLQFITFTIGNEEYGIDIMAVREIKGWTETTVMPKAPPHVRGVINLRGVIIPIYDLRARFGLGLTETTKTHVIIIVSVGARIVGLLVDAVSDILAVDRDAIRPPPDMEQKGDDWFVDGLVALGERMVTLVSLDRLFAEPAAAESLPAPTQN